LGHHADQPAVRALSMGDGHVDREHLLQPAGKLVSIHKGHFTLLTVRTVRSGPVAAHGRPRPAGWPPPRRKRSARTRNRAGRTSPATPPRPGPWRRGDPAVAASPPALPGCRPSARPNRGPPERGGTAPRRRRRRPGYAPSRSGGTAPASRPPP